MARNKACSGLGFSLIGRRDCGHAGKSRSRDCANARTGVERTELSLEARAEAVPDMSKKTPKIAGLIEGCHGQGVDPHYAGFLDCFNRQLFFEAHEVLEELWLEDRHGRNGAFYKGLIQLAGAFVHVQKERLGPAAALFRLARTNLEPYGPVHERLDIAAVIGLAGQWLAILPPNPGHSIPGALPGYPKIFLQATPGNL